MIYLNFIKVKKNLLTYFSYEILTNSLIILITEIIEL